MYLQNCTIIELSHLPGLDQVIGICPTCGKEWKLTAVHSKLLEFMEDKKPIQDIFANRSVEDREKLISGTCDTCFKESTAMFERNM